MKRKPWPYEAESCRLEAQQLADVNTELAQDADAAIRRGDTAEARRINAEIKANNERIARLMVEAKQ